MQFKASQAAAAYVANALSEHQQEAFELHMMGCSECVNDVETWRVIKTHMPAPAVVEAAKPFKKLWWGGWGMAASFVGAVVVSGLAGWFANALERPSLDSSETAIFNMPALTRGVGDCTQLPVAGNTRAVIVRVPGVDSEARVIATDANGRELPDAGYSARRQRDGSWILRFDARSLQQQSVLVATRSPGGDNEALGCVMAAVVPPPIS